MLRCRLVRRYVCGFVSSYIDAFCTGASCVCFVTIHLRLSPFPERFEGATLRIDGSWSHWYFYTSATQNPLRQIKQATTAVTDDRADTVTNCFKYSVARWTWQFVNVASLKYMNLSESIYTVRSTTTHCTGRLYSPHLVCLSWRLFLKLSKGSRCNSKQDRPCVRWKISPRSEFQRPDQSSR